MKIVYASHAVVPSKTANSVHIMKMCSALASLGHDVTLLTLGEKNLQLDNVADVYDHYGVENTFKIVELAKVPFRRPDVIHGIKSLLKIKQIKPDIVFGRALVSCAMVAKAGTKVIYESHAPLHPSFISRFFYKLMAGSPNYKRLIVISEALKKYYLSEQKAEIIVAHDAADERTDFNTKAALSGSYELNIGYTGHLYEGKGVEVIARIAHLMPEVGFHIVGGLENNIKHWQDKINAENVFFYGYKPQNELTGYINAFDICLLPNQKIVRPYHPTGKSVGNISEFTSPLKMFEYMASKKPIISSDLPVLREVLNEQNAILVPCDSTDLWIDAVNRLKDKDLRQKLADRAYQDFIEHYTWKKRAEAVLKGVL